MSQRLTGFREPQRLIPERAGILYSKQGWGLAVGKYAIVELFLL